MSRSNRHNTPAMTEDQLAEVLALQEAHTEALAMNEVWVATPPAEIEVEVTEPAIWTPAPNYAKTVENVEKRVASARAKEGTHTGKILTGIGKQDARANTARAAALAAMQENLGQPYHVVLEAVTLAEKAWHKSNGRTPGNLAPAGWFKHFNAAWTDVVATTQPEPETAPETTGEAAEA